MMKMKMNKNSQWVCPKCGSDGGVVDIEDTSFGDGDVSIDCACEECGYTWIEYLKTIYDGYSDEEGEYDKDGECIVNYNSEEDEDEDS